MSRMFQNWCALRGVQPLPASPSDVAKFVTDISELGPDRVFDEVLQIGRSHWVIDLADPTCNGPVASAMNTLAKIAPPRSWSAEMKQRFLTLPYDIQWEIARRESERDREVRRAQAECGDLKKQLKELEPGKADTIVTAAA
jgi:hypothetical protein